MLMKWYHCPCIAAIGNGGCISSVVVWIKTVNKWLLLDDYYVGQISHGSHSLHSPQGPDLLLNLWLSVPELLLPECTLPQRLTGWRWIQGPPFDWCVTRMNGSLSAPPLHKLQNPVRSNWCPRKNSVDANRENSFISNLCRIDWSGNPSYSTANRYALCNIIFISDFPVQNSCEEVSPKNVSHNSARGCKTVSFTTKILDDRTFMHEI